MYTKYTIYTSYAYTLYNADLFLQVDLVDLLAGELLGHVLHGGHAYTRVYIRVCIYMYKVCISKVCMYIRNVYKTCTVTYTYAMNTRLMYTIYMHTYNIIIVICL